MFDINTLVTFDIKADALTATAGMLIELGDKDLSKEMSQQVLWQLVKQDTDIDGVVAGDVNPVVSFGVPVGVAMCIADVLIQNCDGPQAGSITHLMSAWQPCMEKIKDLVVPRYQHPFDEFGNCMN